MCTKFDPSPHIKSPLGIHFYAYKRLENIAIVMKFHVNVYFVNLKHIINYYWKSPSSSMQYVGLLGVKPGFEPQARHQNNMQKVFLRRFPLCRFQAQTLRVNKIAMKSFLKICLSASTLNYRSRHLCIQIYTHGMRNWVNNLDWRFVMANYVCYYILLRLVHNCPFVLSRLLKKICLAIIISLKIVLPHWNLTWTWMQFA